MVVPRTLLLSWRVHSAWPIMLAMRMVYRQHLR